MGGTIPANFGKTPFNLEPGRLCEKNGPRSAKNLERGKEIHALRVNRTWLSISVAPGRLNRDLHAEKRLLCLRFRFRFRPGLGSCQFSFPEDGVGVLLLFVLRGSLQFSFPAEDGVGVLSPFFYGAHANSHLLRKKPREWGSPEFSNLEP